MANHKHTIAIPDDHWLSLEEIAHEASTGHMRVTAGDLVRQAVDAWLRERNPPTRQTPKRRRAKR